MQPTQVPGSDPALFVVPRLIYICLATAAFFSFSSSFPSSDLSQQLLRAIVSANTNFWRDCTNQDPQFRQTIATTCTCGLPTLVFGFRRGRISAVADDFTTRHCLNLVSPCETTHPAWHLRQSHGSVRARLEQHQVSGPAMSRV